MDIDATGDLDVSAVEMLEQLLDDLADRGTRLVLAQVKGATRDRMQTTGLMERLVEERLHVSMAEAVEAEAVPAAARAN